MRKKKKEKKLTSVPEKYVVSLPGHAYLFHNMRTYNFRYEC